MSSSLAQPLNTYLQYSWLIARNINGEQMVPEFKTSTGTRKEWRRSYRGTISVSAIVAFCEHIVPWEYKCGISVTGLIILATLISFNYFPQIITNQRIGHDCWWVRPDHIRKSTNLEYGISTVISGYCKHWFMYIKVIGHWRTLFGHTPYFYLNFSSIYLKLLISLLAFPGTGKFTLRYGFFLVELRLWDIETWLYIVYQL